MVDNLEGFRDDILRLRRQVAYMLSDWERKELPIDVPDTGVAYHLAMAGISLNNVLTHLAHTIKVAHSKTENTNVL